MGSVHVMLTIVCSALLALPVIVYFAQGKTHKLLAKCPIIRSVSYTPFSSISDVKNLERVSRKTIQAELSILSKNVTQIRTYSSCGVQAYIPEIAGKLGMEVTLGIWISEDLERNQREIIQGLYLIKKK